MASVNTMVSVNQQWASYPTDISPLILKLGLGASWVFLNAWIGICEIQDLSKAVVSYRWTGDRKVSLQQRITEQMNRMEKKWGILTVWREWVLSCTVVNIANKIQSWIPQQQMWFPVGNDSDFVSLLILVANPLCLWWCGFGASWKLVEAPGSFPKCQAASCCRRSNYFSHVLVLNYGFRSSSWKFNIKCFFPPSGWFCKPFNTQQ